MNKGRDKMMKGMNQKKTNYKITGVKPIHILCFQSVGKVCTKECCIQRSTQQSQSYTATAEVYGRNIAAYEKQPLAVLPELISSSLQMS